MNTVSLTVTAALVLCRLGHAALATPDPQKECSVAARACTGRGRAVCGDDDRTYQSRCHLESVRCQGYHVALRHRGPCQQKGDAKRRTSASPRGRRNKKGCSREGRAQFTSNLIAVLRTEYERSGGPVPAPDAAVLDWKFHQVDVNRNSFLDKPEYRDLRRLITKVVQPRRCARSFGRMCDENGDEIITRKEWNLCLTTSGLVPNAKRRNPGESPRRNRGPPKLAEEGEGQGQGQGEGDDDDGGGVLQGRLTRVSAHLLELDDPLSRSKDESDSNDCLSDRKAVLDEQKSGDVLYVPECTADGRYLRVQCYKNTGYCWCVNQESGKPIPGTPIKDQNPHCEALPTPVRPMKGCPESRKAAFLRDFVELMRGEMVKGTNGTSLVGPSEWHASKDEQVATWGFVILDKDKNKVLEGKEWKALRELVTGNRHHQLRRCGKKLPRYCDINQDRAITITEWLNCLETRKDPDPVPSPKSITASKRKGPNPLESYLKGD